MPSDPIAHWSDERRENALCHGLLVRQASGPDSP